MGKRSKRTTGLEQMQASVIRRLRKAFIRKFGRDPGPADPVFFDPDAPGREPVQMTEAQMRKMIVREMERADVPAHIIYAFNRTGLVLVEELRHTYPPSIAAEYDAAIAEFWASKGDGEPH